MDSPWEIQPEHEGLVQLPAPYKHGLWVKVCGPPRKKVGQPVLVLFTGGGAPCVAYMRLIDQLAKEWRVVAYDRAGYDRSEVPWVEHSSRTSRRDKAMSPNEVGRVMLGWETGMDVDAVRVKKGGQDREKAVIMARDSAEELKALLRVIGVGGPYVLLAHSMGAIVAREFIDVMNKDEASTHNISSCLADVDWDDCDRDLASQPHCLDHVVGICLAGPASELMYQTCQPSIPPPPFNAMLKDVDMEQVTHLRRDSGLTDDEWDAVIAAIARTVPATQHEDARASARVLVEKQQLARHALNPWPVSVLRFNFYNDWKRLYDAGVKKGNGTKEERRQCEKFLWELGAFDDEIRAGLVRLTGEEGDTDYGERRTASHSEQRTASSKRRYTYFGEYGHDVPIRKPEVVVEEVKWVLERLADRLG